MLNGKIINSTNNLILKYRNKRIENKNIKQNKSKF